jgi:hypothetical protein
MVNTTTNDPCLECGTPTLGVMELNGATIGIGINRLSYDDGERNGWLCGECAGYECEECGKNIYLDEDINIIIPPHDHNAKYHEACLTPELKAMAIKQGEL